MRKKRVSFKLDRSHRVSRKKPRLVVPIITLIFFAGLGLAVTGGILYDKYNPSSVNNSQSNASTTPTPSKEQKQEDVSDIFSNYDKDLYDKDTNTYSFSQGDYDSLLIT